MTSRVAVPDAHQVVAVDASDGRELWRFTADGRVVGTPAYMPPEMATGAETVDARSDIYALGCVGYWLLTGSHVFSGSTPMKVVVAHVKETPVPPSQRTELADIGG